MNRSYYNATSILSKTRGPSLTPPKSSAAAALTKEKSSKDTKASFAQKKPEQYNIAIPVQNTLFLQQQNAILSARKATLNLNDSSDKARRTSPIDKSPIGTRLATLHKSKQINVSQSQQAINQVLVQMHHDEQQSYFNQTSGTMLQNKLQENDSAQKSTLNSREFTNNSSKHKTEDLQKLQKECLVLQKRVSELEGRNLQLEKYNSQLMNALKMCECNKLKMQEIQAFLGTQSSRDIIHHELRERIFTEQSHEKIKRLSQPIEDFSNIKPTNLFNLNSKDTDQVEDYFKGNFVIEAENKTIRDIIGLQPKLCHIPSVLQAIGLGVGTPNRF